MIKRINIEEIEQEIIAEIEDNNTVTPRVWELVNTIGSVSLLKTDTIKLIQTANQLKKEKLC